MFEFYSWLWRIQIQITELMLHIQSIQSVLRFYSAGKSCFRSRFNFAWMFMRSVDRGELWSKIWGYCIELWFSWDFWFVYRPNFSFQQLRALRVWLCTSCHKYYGILISLGYWLSEIKILQHLRIRPRVWTQQIKNYFKYIFWLWLA